MKKYFVVFGLTVLFAACGGNSSESKEEDTNSVMDNPDYDKGLNLIAKSDCLTCHKLREASTGPAYSAVAEKYENNEANREMLAAKIISGGSGHWGTIPMAAHPNLSKEDAIAMLKYIFLLKEAKK